MLVAHLTCFGLSFLLSLALTALMLRAAPKLGLVDHPNRRKIHSAPVPLGGGIAMALAIIVTLLVVVSAIAGVGKLGPVLAGAGVLAVMGVIDDKRGLSPWYKLSAQIVVGLLLAASGFAVSLFIHVRVVSWLLTAVWIVFVTNSFNLLDNMDGLSGGVAFIIALVFMAVAVLTGQLFVSLFMAVFLGGVLGFLIFNFPPARIFMGDTGSYLLGYFLGVAAVVFTFVPEGTESVSMLPFALPFLLFAIPASDTLSVILIRVREGRHPFEADKRHFSHRLVDLGLSKREAVLTIYAATLVTSFPALYLRELHTWALVCAVVQAVLVLGLIALLEHAGARKFHR